MAYITFDPSSEGLGKILLLKSTAIEQLLRNELPKLGVAPDDVVYRIFTCTTQIASEPQHVEVVLKTDNPKVTAPQIVQILSRELNDVPFEVTRIPVGYFVVELFYEVAAFFTRTRRNWASNYAQI